MPLSVTQVGLLRSLHFLSADRHHSHHRLKRLPPVLIRASLAPQTLTAWSFRDLRKKRRDMDKGRNEQQRGGRSRKRQEQCKPGACGSSCRRNNPGKATKLNREILSSQVLTAVLDRFDFQVNLLSFMGISHSKLGKLGDCLERAGSPPSELDEIISICDRHLTNLVRTFNSCREHVSEFRSMLVGIKTAVSVEKDAAVEEEDAAADTAEEKYAAADTAEDNVPAAEEIDADTDAAEDTDPAAEEKDAAADAAEDNDPAAEEKDADADAAEDNDPADAAAADDICLWSERAFPSVNTTGDYPVKFALFRGISRQ
ncbi:hypothetical protein EJB05_50787 [Eragrostis curvula]|uniref:Uncharacterized protein n=1 Tax=Eragrostis curvula TaxID=38414 RepID=A0A5J9SX95_9POAL|nr:hypothetical protein EJB05_50787 [Eragrostis curvula]